MVERIVHVLSKEFSTTSKAALILGLFSFLSQIFGLVRDKLLAFYIGPSETLDIYYAAFRMPDLLFVTMASITSVTILLPFLVEMRGDTKGVGNSRKLINSVTTTFFFIMTISIAIVFLFAPLISKALVPGFDEEARELYVTITRIMLFSPLFLGISNLFGSITQMFNKFMPYALAPVFYNLGIIVGVFLYVPMGIEGLALGVVIGSLMHAFVQLPVVFKYKAVPKITFDIDWPLVRRVGKVTIPRTLALSLNNVSLIVIVLFASKLSEGSISIYNFSMHIQAVPLGIIGISYAVATFPILTKSFQDKKIDEFLSSIVSSMRQVVFWSIPIAVLFIVLRAQIVRVILGSGQFDWGDTRLTAASFALFAVSIVSQSAIVLLVRGFYAASNTKIPLVINLISSTIIVVLVPVLLQFYHVYPYFREFIEVTLKVKDVPGGEVLMLPMAYSIGTILNSVLLWMFFKKKYMKGLRYSFNRTLVHSVSSALFGGIFAYMFLMVSSSLFEIDRFYEIFIQGFLSGVIGIIATATSLQILKNEEYFHIMKSIKSKLNVKKQLVFYDTEELN